MFDLLKLMKTLPEQPGVYIMKDQDGKPLFISRAENLKRGIKGHLINKSRRNSTIIQHTKDIDYEIITDTLAATRRELELIQRHYPPLNGTKSGIKQYRFVKVFHEEKFPRVTKKKFIEDSDEVLLGPFPKSHHIQRVLQLAANYYQIADCGKEIKLGDDHKIVKTCIRRQTKQCMRPCEVEVDTTVYQHAVDQFISFFEGKGDQLQKDLQMEMQQAVEEKEFERAAKLRDDLAAIKKIGLSTNSPS